MINVKTTDNENSNEFPIVFPSTNNINLNFSSSYREIFKRVLQSALPLCGANIINQASITAETLLLARLNSDTVAAITLIMSMRCAILPIFFSPLNSVSNLIAETNGKADQQLVGKIFQESCLLAAILSVPPVVIFAFAEPILLGLGQEAIIAKIVGNYFKAFVGCIPLLMLSVNLGELASGNNQNHLSLYKSLIFTFPFIAITYLLTFGPARLPAFNEQGPGYAAILCHGLSVAAMLSYYKFDKKFDPYKLFNINIKKYLPLIKEILKLGLPITFAIFGELSTIFASGLLGGLLGTDSLIAQTVASQYSALTYIYIYSILPTCTTSISEALASNQTHDIPRLGNAGIMINVFLSLIMLGLALAIPNQLASIFIDTNDADIKDALSIFKILLPLFMFNQLLDSIEKSTTGALYGMKDAVIPTSIFLFCKLFIGIPSAYLLAFQANLGVIGIALGNTTSLSISSVFLFLRWYQKSSEYIIQSKEITGFSKFKAWAKNDIYNADSANINSLSDPETITTNAAENNATNNYTSKIWRTYSNFFHYNPQLKSDESVNLPEVTTRNDNTHEISDEDKKIVKARSTVLIRGFSMRG